MTGALLQTFVADQIPHWVKVKLSGRLQLVDDPSSDLKEIRAIISGSDGAGNRRIGVDLLNLMPMIEIIAGFGSGYDRIDIDMALSRGITVTNTPIVHAEDTADFVVGLIIATLRQIPQADAFIRSGRWSCGHYPLSPGSLQNRKVGIAGLGSVGKATARRLAAFNTRIAYFGRQQQAGIPYDYHHSLTALAENSDILVVTVPGGASTNNIVNASILRALGSDGYLINVSRGSVVEESALLTALREGYIRGAGLDVFANEPNVNPEFLKLPNVVLQPHMASATTQTRDAMWQLVIDNLASWANGCGPITPIPQCDDLSEVRQTTDRQISWRS